jgi:hypothetical protein
MNDRTLELLNLRVKGNASRPVSDSNQGNAAVDSNADEEACRVFGYLRGMGDQGKSIEFRFASGNRKAFPYSWLGSAEFNPSAGMLLKFVGDLVYFVLIEGSNLNGLVNGGMSLYERGILRHRITWVREMTRREIEEAGEGEVAVRCIRMLSYPHGEKPRGVEWLEAFQE